MFYFKRIIYYNAFQISTPTFVISEIVKLLQYHAILMQHDQWQMGWESAGYRGIVNYFILDIPELELPLMLVQTLFHIVFVLCVIKSYYDITKRISYLYLLGLQLGLYNMFVINAIRVLGQNSEINFQFMMSLFNLLFTNLCQYLSCYILRKIRLVSYCDTLLISQLTTIINSYLYFQPFSNQMAYLKILAIALDRFIQIFESIFYIQYKYEWQGIYFAFEQCKNISFLIVFLQVISSFQLFNNQYVVLYIILCSILTFVISIQFSHIIYDTGTIISNQNQFPYMISMIDYLENKKSSFLYFFVKSQHFDVCKKCKNKYKRMGIKRIKKCLFEQLLLFKPNETNFMLYMEYVNQGQKQPMLAYMRLRQYYCNNQNLSYYFRVKQQVMSKNLQMQINQTKVDLRHIDEIQSNRNTFEESLKFNEIQLKVLPQIFKIVSGKIDLWQQQIKGFQDIYEFQQECISICSLIVKLKQDLEQLLNIDLAHNKVFTNIRNLFTLKYLSLYYTVIMNDLNRGIQIELQYWDVFQAEIGFPNLEINPLYVLQDQICIIDISMIKNLGEIVNDKKYILNFFNYSINDSILIKNVNDLLPQFLVQRHHDQLQKFIQVGQSQLLQKFKLLFGQSKKGFIIPFEIKLVNNFEFTEDFILKGVLAKNNENEFIIFNNQGRILGITQKLFQLLCKVDSQYFQFIKNIGIEQLFPNISDFICKLEYDAKEAPMPYLEDESLLTLKSNFFQYSNNQENIKSSGNQFQTFYETHRSQMNEKLLKQRVEFFEREDEINSGLQEILFEKKNNEQYASDYQKDQSFHTKFRLSQQNYYGSNYFFSMEIQELRSLSNQIIQFQKSEKKINQIQIRPNEQKKVEKVNYQQSVSSTSTKNSSQSNQQVIRDFQNSNILHKSQKLMVAVNLLVIGCLSVFIAFQITTYKSFQDKINFNTKLLQGPIVFNRFFDQVICTTLILCAQATNQLNSSNYRIQQTLDELVILDNYVFGNMSELYDTFIYIEEAGFISSVVIDLGFIPSENATYTKFVSILLSKAKIVFKAGLLKPDQIGQILNASFLNTLLSIRYNVRNLYLMNQEILNTIVVLFQKDFINSEQQNFNIFIIQTILIYILIAVQFFIERNLEIHNQKIIKLIGRSTEEHIIEQIIIYQDILSKLNQQESNGWKQAQFAQLCYQENSNEQTEYSIKNQKNKQSQLHSKIKSDKINLNVQTLILTAYLLVILLFSLGGYILFKVQYNNLQPVQNLNLNYAQFTTQLDSLISSSMIQKLQPLIFNEFVKRNIYTQAQLNTLHNSRIFTVWNAVNKKYYEYFSQLYEGMLKLKTSSPSNYEFLNQLFTGDLCTTSNIRFCNINNMSQSNFINKYGKYDQSDDIRQYLNSGIQGIVDQVQQSIAQDFTYEKKNNLYSSNIDELSQLVNTKEFNHIYINHFTDSYSPIQQFLTILEQTTKYLIAENFQSFTLYMILVGSMLILSIVIALAYLVRRTQLRIQYLKMSILLMPYEQQVTPQAMSIIKQIK